VVTPLPFLGCATAMGERHFHVIEGSSSVVGCSSFRPEIGERLGLEKKIKGRWEERKRLKENLAQAKKDIRLLQKELKDSRKQLDEMPVGMVLVQDEKIQYINGFAMNLLDCSEQELLGKNFLMIAHPDSVDYLQDLHQRRLSGKPVPDRCDAYFLTGRGKKIGCELRVRRVRRNGRRAFLMNLVDLEQRSIRERDLHRSRKREALERISSGILRECNRCMQAIDECMVSVRGVRPSEEDRNACMKKMERVRDRSAYVGRRLSGLMGNKTVSRHDVLDLKKIVREAVGQTRTLWEGVGEEKSIHCKTYLRTLSPIRGDPEEIGQAVVMMIMNAVEAMPGGGEIYLTTEEGSGFANLYIQDNGVGIPEEDQEKVFDPFFTTKGGVHDGLGLSLAEASIVRHGGEIEVMTRQGEGCVFTIKLPLARESIERKRRTAMRRLKNSQLLIISPEEIVRDLLSRLFLSKGSKVMTASTGMEALKIMKKIVIHAVIADLETSDVKTGGMLSMLRGPDQDRLLGVIHSFEEEKESTILKQTGADLVIGRPFDLNRVLKLISEGIAYRSGSQ
jgi:two-component system, cell cycle sensor histidine kinase and response regulator CckA